MEDLIKLPKVGKATVERLEKAGLNTFEAIASTSPQELATKCEIKENIAVRIIEGAKEELRKKEMNEETMEEQNEEIKYVNANDTVTFTDKNNDVAVVDENNDVVPMINTPPNVGLTSLPGVGPAIAKRLEDGGFVTLEAIAVASPKEIAAACEIGESTASKIVLGAQEQLNIGFETALEVLERRQAIGRISTGSKNLDELLGGGIETLGITEFAGEFRTGKTQIAHQLCIIVQLPESEGGLNGSALYLDSEGTFRPERIIQMCRGRNLDDKKEKVLENIIVARAYNSDHQMLIIDQLSDKIVENNIKLIIIDSLISHFRSEYIGRGTLANRQQKLNKHLHQLLKIAEAYNLAVVVTNQVMARPDMFFGDPNTPVGGNVVAHASTTRVYLRKSKGERRIARILDSPMLPEGEGVFKITEDGIVD